MERRRRVPQVELDQEVLYLVACGHTNREIARRLGRTPTAVKALLQRMYVRFWVPNRVALAAYARSRSG